MANTTIGGADTALLRGTSQWIEDVSVHLTPILDAEVATATVDAVPSKAPYVSLTVTWDYGQTDVEVGQLVKITDGNLTLRTWAVVRKDPTLDTLYISPVPLGMQGFATVLESEIQVGDSVQVFKHHPMWGLYSRISNGTFYKQWDVAYTNQNSQPPPVANTGTWQAGKLPAGSTDVPFRLPRYGANTSFALGSATITSYAWELPTGVTLQGGYALTDSVIEVDAVAGDHLVKLTVTDSNSKAHSAYCWLFVRNDANPYGTLSPLWGVEILNDDQTVTGRKITVKVTGDNLDATTFFPSAGVLLREWSKFDGSELTDGVLCDTFVGYVTSYEFNYNNNLKTCTFEAESPVMFAKRVVMAQQSLEEKASPASWVECSSVLSNPRGYLYYLAKWHCPALLDMHDLDAPYTTPRRKYLDFPVKNLGAGLDIVGQIIAGNVGSASDGTTVLRKNQNLRDTRDDYIYYIESSEIAPPVNYTNMIQAPYGRAKTGAFAYDGTSSKAWATQKRWYQGIGDIELPAFSVTASEGVTEAKAVIGHFLAQENRRLESLTINMTRNQDVFDPAYYCWFVVWIPRQYDALNFGFSDYTTFGQDNRFLAMRVTRKWEQNAGGLIKRLSIEFQPETVGGAGEEIIYPKASANIAGDSGYSAVTNIKYKQNQGQYMGGSSLGAGVVLALTEGGELALSSNVLANSPDWDALTDLFTGTINDTAWDYSSAFFANGYNPADSLSLYVLTANGTTLTLYRVADVKATSPQADSVTSVTMNDAGTITEARIVASKGNPDLVIISWHDETGTRFKRSTDGGATWSSITNVGTSGSDTLNINPALGMGAYNSVQLISAPDTNMEYGIYGATTAGGSYSALTGTPRSDIPNPAIEILNDATALVSVPPRRTKTRLTFDAGGEPSYTLPLGGSVTTGGNPDNCAKRTGSGIAPTDALQLTITLPTVTRVYDVGFDYYVSNNNAKLTYSVSFRNNGTTGQDYSEAQISVTNGAWGRYRFSASQLATIGESLFGVWVDEISITISGHTTATAWDYRLDNIVIYAMDNLGDYTAVDFEDNEEFSAYTVTVNTGDTLTRSASNLMGTYAQRMTNNTLVNQVSFLNTDIDLGTTRKIWGIAFNARLAKSGGTSPSTPETYDDSSLAIYDGGVQQWSGSLTKFKLYVQPNEPFMQWIFEPFFKQYGEGGVDGDNVVLKIATTTYDGTKRIDLDSVFIFEERTIEGVFYESAYGIQDITNTAVRCTGVIDDVDGSEVLGYPMGGMCFRGTGASASAGTATYVGLETDINLPDYITLWDINFAFFIEYTGFSTDPVLEVDIYERGETTPTTLSYTDTSAVTVGQGWFQARGQVTLGMNRAYTTKRVVIRLKTPTDRTNYDLRLDSIILFKQPFMLYQISDYDGTPSFTERDTLDVGAVRPYAMSSDIADSANVFLAGDTGQWISSGDSGATWASKETDSTKRTFQFMNDTVLSAGDDSFDVSLDNNTSNTSILGNLSAVLGGVIGTIKRILAL